MLRFLAYVWVGLILGVSFLATPIKFQAESLTLPVALDVGRATFHAFNKVEWALLVAAGAVLVTLRDRLHPVDWSLLVVVAVILAAQTFYLLPRLDARVATIIAGGTPPPSPLHAAYAGIELAKAATLLLIGMTTATGRG